MIPARRQEVADDAEMIGQLFAIYFRDIPAWDVGMNSIHKCRIVTHLWWKRSEQMTYTLLVFYVHFEVSDHDHSAKAANALFAPAELTGFHIALHDVDSVLLVKRDTSDFIEANYVVLADKASLPVGVIDKHLCNRGLAAGDKMGVWRYLLVKMALACSARPKLHRVVVVFNKWDHSEEHDVARSLSENGGLKPDASQEQILPFFKR